MRGSAAALCVAAMALTGLQPHKAYAEEPTAQISGLSSWLQGQYMTGDWGGTRTSLEARGVTFRAGYLSESAANPVGGLRQGATYTQQVDAGVDLDLGKLIGLPGGKIHALFTERAGQSLAAQSIGSIISVQEVFGSGQNVRLAELSYEQALFEQRLNAKLGWIHASDDFASSPLYCYFQNNGFCGQVAIVINSGFTIFPSGSWGSVVKARVRDDLYLQAGVYEAFARKLAERAAALRPVDPAIGLEAGVIAMLAGQPDAARKSWQSVVTMAPDSETAVTARGYLAQIAAPAPSAAATRTVSQGPRTTPRTTPAAAAAGAIPSGR